MSETYTNYGLTCEVGGLAVVDVRNPSAEQDFVTLKLTYLDEDGRVNWQADVALTAKQAAMLAHDLKARARDIAEQIAA